MGFDKDWFNHLRDMSQEIIEKAYARGIGELRPNVAELCGYRLVHTGFYMKTVELVRAFEKTKYKFSPYFRAYERHICDFPKGKAFRKQWNIGFYAGSAPSEDCVRIGLGFSLNMQISMEGIEEYMEFVNKVRTKPSHFDAVFNRLGGYAEPEHLTATKSLSSAVLADSPRYDDDWRFFGSCLRFADPDDMKVITDTTKLVHQAVDVFDQIEQSGFA